MTPQRFVEAAVRGFPPRQHGGVAAAQMTFELLELGSAGERCINERKPGANPPWAVCAPNCPNWFTLYRDPIANDTPHNSADQILQQLSVGSSGNLMRFAVFAVLVWAVMR